MRTPPPAEMVEALEAGNRELVGKRTRDVPILARPRLYYRRRFYASADFFFGAAVFNWIVANLQSGFFARLSLAATAFSLTGLLFCELRARLMTRQLQRRAAEQLALDILGRHSE